jgi:hypothetical protein
MKVVVIYESMYGNTHAVAEAIGMALRADADVTVLALERATAESVEQADMLVVGGPTHVHGMSRPSTLKAAVDAVEKDPTLELDPDAPGPGIRDWLAALPELSCAAAAFDTRIDAPASLTGRASRGIARQLRKHGCTVVTDPESFLVTKHNELEPGEADRAAEWARSLVAELRRRGLAPAAADAGGEP